MSKCFRCGREKNLRKIPKQIDIWGDKSLCSACYAQVISDHVKDRNFKKFSRRKSFDFDMKIIAFFAITIIIVFFVVFVVFL